MARVNVEDSLFTDDVFIKLCAMLRSEIRAIGYWVKVARLAQSYWMNDQNLIPKEVYNWQKFPKQFIDSGMVRECENGFYLHGSGKNFAWIYAKVENGKKGGRPTSNTQQVESKKKDESYDITETKATDNPPTLTPTPPPTKKKKKSSPKKITDSETEIAKQVIDYFIKVTGKTRITYCKASIKIIVDRLRDGYTSKEMEHIIDVKLPWLNNPAMQGSLKFDTIFRECHFENYLNEKTQDQIKKEKSLKYQQADKVLLGIMNATTN